MFCKLRKKNYPIYISNHNPNREKQAIFLMIPNGEGWNYIAVKIAININKRNTISVML